MKKIILIGLSLCIIQITLAQQTVVPKQMAFADLILKVNENAQRIIQNKADSIKRNLEKVQLYYTRLQVYSPLVIPILKAQNVHPDFRHIMLMESGAEGNFEHQKRVGFWAISDEQATEIGLQTQNPDLRKHLTHATERLAQFFANNQYYLRNSLYTVLSHKIGLIQTNKLITNEIKNNSELIIDENTHPYLINFAAHFLVFNQETDSHSDFRLWKFDNPKNYSALQIAQLTELSTDEILTFNEWILDVHKCYENCPILLPVRPESFEKITRKLGYTESQSDFFQSQNNTKLEYPMIIHQERVRFRQQEYTLATINGLRGVLTEHETQPSELAELGRISVHKFLKINDMSEFDNIQTGKVYYFEPKKNTVSVQKYTLKHEETFWDVAQKFALKLHVITKNNAIQRNEFPKAGRVLYLSQKSPKIVTDTLDNVSEFDAETNSNHTVSKDTLLYHTVKKGENLFQIAKKYQVSIAEIRNWNNLGNNLNLMEGKILKILKINTALPTENEDSKPVILEDKTPQIEYTPDSLYILHTVQKNETPYQIAQKYNITTEAILKWNNLKTNSVLLYGDKIRVKVREGEMKKPEPFFRKPIPIVCYLVIKPESMTRIAYKLNIPLNRLAKWNPTQSMQSDLMPGTKLDLKGEINVYNAGFGENIYTIAKHLQIEDREIARWNNKPMSSYAIGIGGEQLLLKPYGEKQKVIPSGYIEPEQIMDKKTNSDSLNNTKKDISDFHILEPAQNLKQVAQQYDLEEEQLISWNHLTASDLQNLNTGDTIFLNQTSALFAENQHPWHKIRFKSPYNFALYHVIPADYHIYQTGETLAQISASEAVGLEKLKSWNQVPDNVLFMAGDTLLLTNPMYLEKKQTRQNSTAPSEYLALAGAFYVVKKGDNIYAIADKFDVKVSELRTWNALPLHISDLREGMRLVVQLRKK